MAAAEIIDRIRTKRAGEYTKSPDFQGLIISGFAQMQAGENPVDLLKATSDLSATGIPAANAHAIVGSMIGQLQQAAQHKEFNAVQKENAPQPEFMKTVTPDPRERDSMEMGGFDPAQNESLSKMMPAQPEKPFTPNQIARIAGPKSFENLSQAGSFMQVPQHQELLSEQASRQKSQRRIEEMIADQQERDRPLNDFATSKALGVNPDEYEQLTGRPYPLKRSGQTLESLGLGGDGGAADQGPNPNIGITRNAKGQTSIRVNPERQAQGAQNRIFAEYEREQKALGKTATEIREGWQAILRANSAATAGGAQQGALDVRRTPSYIENKTDVARAGAVGTAEGSPLPPGVQENLNQTKSILFDIDGALENFNPEAIGPIAGKKTALRDTFGETPIIGPMLGGPLNQQTKDLQTFVTRVRNTIRKERFGATLTTNELKAAEGELVSMERSPASALNALQNLRKIFQTSEERIKQQGVSPRGGGQAQGEAPEGTRMSNPSSGETFIKRGGKWVPIQ